MKRRTALVLAAAAVLLICAAVMASSVLHGAKPQPSAAPPAETPAAKMPAAEPSADAEVGSAAMIAAESAYVVAGQYWDIYDALYTGGGLKLTDEQEREIIDRLGSLGYVAAMQYGGTETANAGLAAEFMSAYDSGSDTRLTVYELCPDAGFLRHELSLTDGELNVTRTRLAWLAGDGTRFQGSEPTVTYSETYDVTALYAEDGWLCYDYYLPDNPAGSKHDGHIETLTRLWIGEDQLT